MKISVEVTNDTMVGMSKRDYNATLADTFARLGEEWHAKFRPNHFTSFAYSEYQYQRRSFAYNRLKQRKLGHQNPLHFTGDSKRLSGSATITATKNGVTVTMPVRTFNYKTKHMRMNMREEFTRISSREVAKLERLAETVLTRLMNRRMAARRRKAA